MKKLLLTLTAIVVAGIAQAASVDWGTDKNAFLMKSGADASGITVYLLNASAGESYTSLLSGLADGSVTSANIASQAAYLGSGTTGTTSKKYGKVEQTTASSSSLIAGNDYDLAYVVFETIASGENEGNWFYVSSTASGSAWQAATEYSQDLASVAKWNADTYVASNWAKAGAGGAPEPTSGLLLLVGGAMLALRRKRA